MKKLFLCFYRSAELVQDTAQHLPLRTLKGVKVETVSVTEIKDEL